VVVVAVVFVVVVVVVVIVVVVVVAVIVVVVVVVGVCVFFVVVGCWSLVVGWLLFVGCGCCFLWPLMDKFGEPSTNSGCLKVEMTI